MSGEPEHVLDGSAHPALLVRTHGGLEAAKWAAFAFMVCDHVNDYLLRDFVPILYLLGRLVFPMFALCLAFGLAGRGLLVLDGTIRRLLIWAFIAQVPWSMFPHSDTLNVIFAKHPEFVQTKIEPSEAIVGEELRMTPPVV